MWREKKNHHSKFHIRIHFDYIQFGCEVDILCIFIFHIVSCSPLILFLRSVSEKENNQILFECR